MAADAGESELGVVLERLEAFEQRLGVRLDALGIRQGGEVNRGSGLWITGELHAVDGSTLERDVKLVATGYDSAGRVLETDWVLMDSDDFYGFEAFQIFMALEAPPLAKIRLYPKGKVA
jgi:hypothetical protein